MTSPSPRRRSGVAQNGGNHGGTRPEQAMPTVRRNHALRARTVPLHRQEVPAVLAGAGRYGNIDAQSARPNAHNRTDAHPHHQADVRSYMYFYLAGSFNRRMELRNNAEVLTALGHHVTSRWLFDDRFDVTGSGT